MATTLVSSFGSSAAELRSRKNMPAMLPGATYRQHGRGIGLSVNRQTSHTKQCGIVRRMRNAIMRQFSSWRVSLQSKATSVIGWLLFLYLSATMLFQYDTDTTDVSGTAFVAVSILAGLAFTYAGVLEQSDPDRDDIVYASERLCQGAMVLLAASLLKQATLVVPAQLSSLPMRPTDLYLFVKFLQSCLFIVFTFGFVASRLGYDILGNVLMRRMSRRPDQRMFPPHSKYSRTPQRRSRARANE